MKAPLSLAMVALLGACGTAPQPREAMDHVQPVAVAEPAPSAAPSHGFGHVAPDPNSCTCGIGIAPGTKP